MALTTTTSFLDALLMIRNGDITARWNFPAAWGSYEENPAGIGDAVTVFYHFAQVKQAHSWEPGFEPFTNVQKGAARDVMQAYSDVANIRLLESAFPTAYILLMNGSLTEDAAAWAYQPNFSYSTVEYPAGNYIFGIGTLWAERSGGDIWMNSRFVWENADYGAHRQARHVIAHEVAHALGLKHAWEGFSNTPDDGFVLPSSQSTLLNTLMGERAGYNNYAIQVGVQDGRPVVLDAWYVMPDGPMMEDIAALQYLYGANMETRKGDTVYRWARNEEFVECLWDGGGTDTIDCSAQTFTCIIDLRDGRFSSVGLRQTDAEKRIGLDLPSTWTTPLPDNLYDGRNNLSIARGAVIENAIGGRGHDQITGNAVANRLEGGAGNDTLIGAQGNDTLDGGLGADRMVGGTGNDTYTVDAIGDVVEELASAGVDLLTSHVARVVLPANVENGRVAAAGAADMSGNALDNVIFAGAGNNGLAGGAGNDTLSYQFAGSGVVISLASTAAQETGGSGSDKVSGFENLAGSKFSDRLAGNGAANALSGGAGDDTLEGSGGHDVLQGDGGNDVLIGGTGGDVLSGGAGNDLFRFLDARETGLREETRDVVTDFRPGRDQIDLSLIDANPLLADDQEFSYLGSMAFGRNATGQLRLEDGVLYGSTDADPEAEFSILLTGVTRLQLTDLVL